MTIHEVASQLHRISVGGYFGGEKLTVRQVEGFLSSLLRTGDRVIWEISLPDGRWFFSVNRFSQKPDGFDYTIPETREQEARIKSLL